MGIESLAQIPRGDVRTFLCSDVMGTLTWLDSQVDPIALKVVAQAWDQLPDDSAIVTDTLTAIAKASRAIWPSWYGQENLLAAAEITLEQRIRSQSQTGICGPWAKAAVHACELGRLPLPSKFSNSLHLSQLALTIGPDKLAIILAVKDFQPEFRLFGFAKAANWIAQESGSRVAVLIPTDLADHEALASILYGAVEIAPASPSLSTEVTNEKPQHFVWHQGKPHSESPGERKLADRLSRDDELATLFWFNQSVKTVRDSLYLVDLLWTEGKVVVEIDGYKHHSDRLTFSADRNRDYELLISDYVVLRLPHHEVVSDIEIAVEKIRDVVRFRRQQLNRGER